MPKISKSAYLFKKVHAGRLNSSALRLYLTLGLHVFYVKIISPEQHYT